ncbi:4c0aa34d-c625-433f-ab30-56b406ac204d [Thermothielavioides terrestris]|uniref:cAMP-dependent protein kinase n=1 Tax=Thermothielavioides terrestris TaxID=2587410 RepID=A0A3S4BGM6_9PEZI|nr:4c0aa34d-c625-433f-ab30-56b406ac204d [Thermothielavioides terrestris]
MAATVAHSQHAPPPGLHPLQTAPVKAAGSGQEPTQKKNILDDKPFDIGAGRLSASDFVRVRTLGTGTFARVCLVRPSHGTEADRSKVYALKILRKTEVIKQKQLDHVRHERQILADVRGHPFITNFLASFADHDFLYFLLDYVPGGELFTYVRKFRRFDEDTARFYAAEIVLVLEHLHEEQGGVAYRDLKPENLLLDAEGHIKLVDFGFAVRLGNNESGHPVETYTMCGTPEYIAPEVIHNKGHTTAVDWWALGILIYEFLMGFPPFWHSNKMELFKQIVEKPVVFPSEPPVSAAAQDIIRQLCTVDRSRRLGNISGGAARVKEHPFFAAVDWDACFDVWPEEDEHWDEYTDELAERYEACFSDF